MGLPGEGIEHAPNGDAREDTVVAPEAHVDCLKGCGHRQGCGTKGGIYFRPWKNGHFMAHARSEGAFLSVLHPITHNPAYYKRL